MPNSLLLWLLFPIALSLPAFADEERPPPLNCEAGPLHRTYGNTPWVVYACDDMLSAVVVADLGNSAQPFYFILYVKPDGQMRLYGEGSGDRKATQAAFDELEQLTQADVAALVRAAMAVGASREAD